MADGLDERQESTTHTLFICFRVIYESSRVFMADGRDQVTRVLRPILAAFKYHTVDLPQGIFLDPVKIETCSIVGSEAIATLLRVPLRKNMIMRGKSGF